MSIIAKYNNNYDNSYYILYIPLIYTFLSTDFFFDVWSNNGVLMLLTNFCESSRISCKCKEKQMKEKYNNH